MPDFGQLLTDVVQGVLDGITGLISNLAAGAIDVLSGIVALFPTADPLGLSASSGILRGYSWLNSWLPVSETLTAIGLIVLVATTVFAVRVAIKLWEWLPFKFS